MQTALEQLAEESVARRHMVGFSRKEERVKDTIAGALVFVQAFLDLCNEKIHEAKHTNNGELHQKYLNLRYDITEFITQIHCPHI